jgi:hypothetical protein
MSLDLQLTIAESRRCLPDSFWLCQRTPGPRFLQPSPSRTRVDGEPSAPCLATKTGGISSCRKATWGRRDFEANL